MVPSEVVPERQEGEYDSYLRSLQQYICELLIKNQQLRWTVESARNQQKGVLGNDHDEVVARNRS
jgi:hypothetical protein